MYSYEDRIRAVQLYIKLGRRMAATLRHYRWPEWISRTRKAKLTRSMSKKGCSPDNAACEGFFGRLKTELVYPRNWQDVALDDFVHQVDAYIRWYNERRIKLSLGQRSPREYRHDLGLIPS